MQYPDRPHGGEGRSESDNAGSATSDIYAGGTQFEAQEMVEALNHRVMEPLGPLLYP